MAPLDATASYEDMGPSLLAQQPLTLKRVPKTDEEWGQVFFHLESRMNGLRNWRWSWWAYWNVLAEFFLPRRHKFFVTANTMNRGRPINDAIIDSTGTLAVNVCASGLWTGLTNPSRPWFKLTHGLPWMELDAAGKAWLEDTEERVYTVLHQSNFYTVMAQAFQDVTVFGTAPLIMYEDSQDILRCYLPCAGEYFLAAGPRLSVDTLYREFTFTVQQIVGMFRLENCPTEVRKLWETGGGSLEVEFVVCHAIEPNFPIQARGKGQARKVNILPSGFTYRELYWIKGKKGEKPLSKRGFYEQPFMVARWSTVSNDPYGRSPCMDALGDNKQIQTETRRKAEFIEKGVRPPMGADPVLKNEPASIIPAQITYVDSTNGKKGFWPLFEVQPTWLSGLVADIEGVAQRINRCLFVDVFMAITQMQGVQPRNELELTKRDLERLQVLGPFVEMFENEFAGPAIRRVLSILHRRRLLKPMPPSLQKSGIKIEYVSIMRLAQRSAESIAMKDTFETMGELSAAAKASGVPDPIRTFDLDKAARKYADLNNFPQDCVFTPEQVEQHDQARAQANKEAQVMPATMAGVEAAKTLSDTKVGGGSLLNSLLTGQTAPQQA